MRFVLGVIYINKIVEEEETSGTSTLMPISYNLYTSAERFLALPILKESKDGK